MHKLGQYELRPQPWNFIARLAHAIREVPTQNVFGRGHRVARQSAPGPMPVGSLNIQAQTVKGIAGVPSGHVQQGPLSQG